MDTPSTMAGEKRKRDDGATTPAPKLGVVRVEKATTGRGHCGWCDTQIEVGSPRVVLRAPEAIVGGRVGLALLQQGLPLAERHVRQHHHFRARVHVLVELAQHVVEVSPPAAE